jgi:predicted DNA-binding transcriptional regulator AlpA
MHDNILAQLPELWDVRRVAAFFKVSPKTIRTWTNRGSFPPMVRLGPGKLIRWRADDIHKFIAAGCPPAPAAAATEGE